WLPGTSDWRSCGKLQEKVWSRIGMDSGPGGAARVAGRARNTLPASALSVLVRRDSLNTSDAGCADEYPCVNPQYRPDCGLHLYTLGTIGGRACPVNFFVTPGASRLACLSPVI